MLGTLRVRHAEAMQGTLNIFQKTMLQWSELHPYNAAHVATVSEPLDLPRLDLIVDRFIEKCGLNSLSLDRAKGTYRYHGGPFHHGIEVVGAEQDEGELLQGKVAAELNTPFPSGERMCPVRFFAVDFGRRFHLGLTYSHFVSGADSMVLLLKSIITAYRERDASAFNLTLDLYPRAIECC